MRKQLPTKLLSAFLAVCLVTGLSPATALAVQENAENGANAGSQSSQVSGEAASESKDAIDKAAPADDGEAVDDSAVISETDVVKDAPVAEGDAAPAEEMVAAPEENASESATAEGSSLETTVSENTEKEAEPAAKDATPVSDLQDGEEPLLLKAQNYGPEDAGTISLGEGVDLDASDGERWLKFTPADDGWYVFYSWNDSGIDPRAELFEEGDYENYIAYDDDDAGDWNFRLKQHLNGEQTYYLKIYYRDEQPTGNCTVTLETYNPEEDAIDITDCELLGIEDHAYTGSAISLENIRVYVGDSCYWLNTGSVEYSYTLNGVAVTEVCEPGVYTVTLTGVPEYGYKGTTQPATFSVIDGKKDITSANVIFDPDERSFVWDGNPHAPNIGSIEGYDDGASEWVALGPDDYVVEYAINGSTEYSTDMPVDINYYTMRIRGIGDWLGSLNFDFYITTDPNVVDIATASIDMVTEYEMESGATELEYTIEYEGAPLVLGQDYLLHFYLEDEYWGDRENAVELGGFPAAAGRYIAEFEGIGNYLGSVPWSFTINSANDFSNYPKFTFDIQGGGLIPDVDGMRAIKQGDDISRFRINGNAEDESGYIQLEEGKDFTVQYRLATNVEEPYEWGEPFGVDAVDVNQAGQYLATITAIEGSGYTGTAEVRFVVVASNNLAAANIFAQDVYAHSGGTAAATVNVEIDYQAVGEEEYDLEWYRYDDAEQDWVRDYDLDGSALPVGEYAVCAVARIGGNYVGNTARTTVRVLDASDLSYGQIVIDKGEFEYSGNAVHPNIEFYAADGQLVDTSNYEVVFVRWLDDGTEEELFEISEIGSYTVRVKAADGNSEGYYGYNDNGSVTIWDPADISWANVDHQYYVKYTGEPIDESDFIYAVMMGDKELVAGTDYYVEYYSYDEDSNEVEVQGKPVDIGYYRVLIHGKGEYRGVYERLSLEIVDGNNLALAYAEIEGDKMPAVRDGETVAAPHFKLMLDGVELREGTDYEVKYGSMEGGYLEDTSALGVGEYRAYFIAIEGSGYTGYLDEYFIVHDAWDLTMASFDLPAYAYPYTGNPVPITIENAIAADGLLLDDNDYDIVFFEANDDGTPGAQCEWPSEIGKYHVVLSGKGSYSGQTMVRGLEIVESNSLSLAEIQWTSGEIGEYVQTLHYTGTANIPGFELSVGGTLLRENVDYTVKYGYLTDGNWTNVEAPMAVGHYEMYVEAVEGGDYKGYRYFNFDIDKAPVTVTANAASKGYGASDPQLTATVTGLVAGETIDYSVARAAGEGVGSYAITPSGSSEQGNYVVTYKPATFTINAMNVSGASFGAVAAQAYTGAALTPAVTVTCAGKQLVKGTDYTIVYANNVNAGTASYTVTGKGNYAGTKTGTFAIKKAGSSISLKAQSKTYAAKALAYSGAVTKSGSAGAVSYAYYSDSACKKPVAASKVKAAGTYYVKATLAADINHAAATSNAVKFTINKAKNPMVVKASKKSVKASTLKSKKVVVAPLKVTKKQGKVTYVKSSGSKNLTVNKSTGKVTVKKGTKKGTYKAKIKVTAAGNSNYKKLSKTVTVTIVVK